MWQVKLCDPSNTCQSLARLLTYLLCVYFTIMRYCRRTQFADGTEIERCTFRLQRPQYLAYYMADLVIFYIIPLFLSCLLYALIARILLLSTRSTGIPGSSTPTTAAGAAQRPRPAAETTAARIITRSTSSTSSRIQV